MRLSLFPFLPEALVMSLGEIGIQTDADLLFSKSAAEIVQSLPSGTLTLQDLRRYTSQVTEKAAALGVRGDHLLAFKIGKQDQPDGFDFMSGISNLDALLGPSCGSRVLELSGEKASGKTVSFSRKWRPMSAHTISFEGSRKAYHATTPCQKSRLRGALDRHDW